MSLPCPNCSSGETKKLAKKQIWICRSCEEEFIAPVPKSSDFDLKIYPIREPRVGDHLIKKGLEVLKQFRGDVEDSINQVSFSKSRIDFLVDKLKNRRDSESFELATDVVGRERLLLHLYIARNSKDTWLPVFTQVIAESVLGSDGRKWPSQRRWLAAQLFFIHFTELPACSYLAERLQEAYGRESTCRIETDKIWNNNSAILFKVDGPLRVASSAVDDEKTIVLLKRLSLDSIPTSSFFLKKLNEEMLLGKLQTVPLGEGEEVLTEFLTYSGIDSAIPMKELEYEGGVPLGAAALRILTKRSLQNGGEWQGCWPDWILKIGCDPSLPQNSAEFNRWWGCWQPSRDELLCAQRALNKKTLEYFLKFLDESLKGTPDYHMYERRAWFLSRLEETRKINRFRLILNNDSFNSLPSEFKKQRHMVCKHDGYSTQASVIVMECVDDVWIFEGTHSYAIRAFHKNPPARVFFENNAFRFDSLTQGEMHSSRVLKTGIYKPHQGDWIFGGTGFLRRLVECFRVEWRI